VGQDNSLNLMRRNGKFRPVLQPPFFLSLEKPAIDQQFVTGVTFFTRFLGCCVDEVLGTCNGTRSTEELNVTHAAPSILKQTL